MLKLFKVTERLPTTNRWQFKRQMSILNRCLIILSLFHLTACTAPQMVATPEGYLTKTGQVGLVGSVAGAAIGGTATAGVGGAAVGALAGGIVGTTIGHFLEQNQSLINRIREQGVQVIVVGDNVLFILPTDKFFYTNSSRRLHLNDAVLMDIARLITPLEKITVKVAAYTDGSQSAQQDQALTEQQAQAIVDYLWAVGMDTRIVFGQGYGSASPIADNGSSLGRIQNRRIEISLRILPTCCVLPPGSGGE